MLLSLFWVASLEQPILLASLSLLLLLLLRMSSQSICAIRLNRSATQWAVSLASGSWSQQSVIVSHRKCIPWNEQGMGVVVISLKSSRKWNAQASKWSCSAFYYALGCISLWCIVHFSRKHKGTEHDKPSTIIGSITIIGNYYWVAIGSEVLIAAEYEVSISLNSASCAIDNQKNRIARDAVACLHQVPVYSKIVLTVLLWRSCVNFLQTHF